MIRIGVAGIPLSCKDRTNRDGIIYTKNLGLSAMEIQFARGFISEEEAKEIRDVANKCVVEMFIHSPYYINLLGNERNVEMSKNKIRKSVRLANVMGAKVVTIHTGFYGSLSKKKAIMRFTKNIRSLRDEFKKDGIEVPVGIETMGKKEVFGSLEEIVEVCKCVRGTVPVLDAGHIHARSNGCLKDKEGFQEVFDKVSGLELEHYLIHITGVKYNKDGEMYHVPIRKGDMPVIKLMECIIDNGYNVTIISESPILEHDAVYSQILLDRAMEMSK
ncbi:MAG: TIM barrel protein [Candidatus Thermoplasmatota archaeon]|nr:TIM barrel protein [Candidatus Thermoplasmatota archaeon]